MNRLIILMVSKIQNRNKKITAFRACIDKVIDINQSPIGRTPRSNPGKTYTAGFSEIRRLINQKPPKQPFRGL